MSNKYVTPILVAGLLNLFLAASAFAGTNDEKRYAMAEKVKGYQNFMTRVFLLLCVCFGLSGLAAAQNTDDYKKTEFFVGYSNEQADNRPEKRQTLHGFEASGVYNFTRYLGVKGDFSAAHGSHREVVPPLFGGSSTLSFRSSTTLYNILGGIQVKDNASTRRFKPFAHALVGVGHSRTKLSDFQCTSPAPPSCFSGTVGIDRITETGLAGAFGGGLDIRINKRIHVRVIQIDYNPVRLHGVTQNDFRFGSGIVF